MYIKLLLVFHILGACIWVGGHLLLLIRYLPEALKTRNPDVISNFEERFEYIGIPALIVQVITGIFMGLHYDVQFISFSTQANTVFNLKLIILLLTFILAVHARIFIIPKLSGENLTMLAYHIAAITLLSIIFVYLGVSFRFGL